MADSKEVKDVERVEIKPAESEEGEEVITKSEDIEEKETPSESSSEEKPSETTEGEEEKEGEELVTSEEEEEPSEPSKPEEDKGVVETSGDELGDEIKRLPGETPREHALRLEVTRLKRGNREKRTKELLGEPEKPSGLSKTQYEALEEEDKKILAEYDPKELSTFEKILGVLGRKHGWVKKGDLKTTTDSRLSEDMLDDFLQNHSEYLPENDKDDVLWNTFKEEFKLYKTPKNPKDLRKIFNKIHRDIFGVKSEDGLKKINAQKEKVKVASHSGSSAARGVSSPEGAKLTPDQKSHLKGFTDKELEEM